MNLRTIVAGGLLATTAIGASLALASSANAAEPVTATGRPGTLDTTNSSTATGVLTPDSIGGRTFAFTGANGGYHYSYGGSYVTNGAWTTASATADDGSYHFGTDGATGSDDGTVIGSFIGIPDCSPAASGVNTPAAGHGQCVSGATHAGIKGNALAAIAKDQSKVGPYGNATCPPVK